MAQQTPKDTDELVMLALGGLGEIGMNTYLYGYGPAKHRQWLMVDLGITFPHESEPGVDVILPDIRFIAEQRANLQGIVITHAHEDHIGAVLELYPQLRVPVYATPYTLGMLKAKLGEFGGKVKPDLREVPLGSRFQAGVFDIELVDMAHSIPEVSALAIRTPAGLILHTSDWKLDPEPVVGRRTDEAKLAALGDEGILAVICDSTNAIRDGVSPSESDIARSLAEIIKAAPYRVAVTTFASNVGRVKAVADAARACGRHLVVAGRALHRVIEVAIDTGYLPKDFKYLDQEEFSYLERREIVVLCTGTQGEPRAAIARISENEHPDIKLTKGDLVIFSSRAIPGNEKVVGQIHNNLSRLGCEVLTDAEAPVHVTGHPRRGELRKLYALTRPAVMVPMHGEPRHLRENAKVAEACGVKEVVIAEDGAIVRLAPGKARIIGDAPVGRIYRDGKLMVSDSENGPVRQRRKLSAVGIAIVSLAVTRKGDLVGDAEVLIDGVPQEARDGDQMTDVILDAVDGTFESIPPGRRKDIGMLTEAVRRAVRAAIGDEWGKKPIVKILVHVVDGKVGS